MYAVSDAMVLAKRSLLLVVERLPFSRIDPVGDLGRGRACVVHAGQRRHRRRPLLAAPNRHMGRLIGAENGQRMLQRFELAAEMVDFFEGHG